MYIYNISFMVERAVTDRWMELLRENYIPLLRQEGFEHFTFSRVISQHASDESIYSLQIRVDELVQYQHLQSEWFAACQAAAAERFGTQVMHVDTLMKILDA